MRLIAQSRVLTAIVYRECSSPGGVAERVSQQTADTDQPWAYAQVSGQVGEEGPHPDNQPTSWGLTTGYVPSPVTPVPLHYLLWCPGPGF